MRQNGPICCISRRQLLAGLTASFPLLLSRPVEAGGAEPLVRVGAVRGGTLNWLLNEIAAHALDRTAGIRINAVAQPEPEASEAALRDRQVDLIVSDWFWVARERSAGNGDWTSFPFSSASGSLVTQPASAIYSLDDVKGRRIGVVGTRHDQAWTILRLAAHRSGWDLEKDSRPEFGSPAKIAAGLESGDFDVAQLIWPWAVRLEARGKARKVLSIEEALRMLGLAANLPLLSYVFSERWAKTNPAAIGGFLRAAYAASARLASSDEDWQRLMPLTGARDAIELEHIRDLFRSGIPRGWGPAAEAEAAKLFEMIAKELGGPELTGQARTIAPGTFFSIIL